MSSHIYTSVVITGSTRGIGFSLARAFLDRNCSVTISGRTQEGLDQAASRLARDHSQNQTNAVVCDVTDYDQVIKLWEIAKNRFGKVDIWINNAGISAPMVKFWELAPEQYDNVVRTNIIGTMYGSRVALKGMLEQGHGALYNLEGYGASGRRMQGASLYGSTKACVHFIDRCLADETSGTPIIIGAIAPGMVITELVTDQFKGREAELEKSKHILNIIAERAETVAPVLADKILKNQENGVTISFNSPFKMAIKFFTAPFKKRDLFASD